MTRYTLANYDTHAELLRDGVRIGRIDVVAEGEALVAALNASVERAAALRLAREFGVSSVGYHAMQASVLADWIDGGMRAPVPIYDSPLVKQYLERRKPTTPAQEGRSDGR